MGYWTNVLAKRRNIKRQKRERRRGISLVLKREEEKKEMGVKREYCERQRVGGIKKE